MKKVVLICTPLRFYAPNDETAFFEWLKKLSCIESIKGIGKELHLSITSSTISDEQLRDFFALFKRYKFKNAKQLELFKNQHNAHWFMS